MVATPLIADATVNNKHKTYMKTYNNIGLLMGVLFTTLLCSSCTKKVEAGYEGVKFDLYGDTKGVQQVPVGPGLLSLAYERYR